MSAAVHTSRTPLTTTEPSATTQPSLMVLPGCGCAIDGDTVISTYNATVYEVYRYSVYFILTNRTKMFLSLREGFQWLC